MMDQYWTRLLPPAIRVRLEGRWQLQSILGNVSWLLADRILRLILSAAVGVVVARYLGPTYFGMFSYATAFVSLFAALATLGLNSIVVREIVRSPESRDEILGTTFFLKLIGGAVAALGVCGTVALLRPDDVITRWLVGITAAGILVQAFDTIDLSFQAQVLSKYTVYGKSVAFFAISLTKLELVRLHAPLIAFAWAGLAEIALGAIGLVIVYRHCGYRISAWHGSMARACLLMRDAWPIMLSGLAVNVYMYIDQLMLGQMTNLEAVGIYSAATRLSELWYFVPLAIASSLLPSIVSARNQSEAEYDGHMRRLFMVMAIVSYVVALPTTLIAGRLVMTLFGSQYAAAGSVLAIHIWAGVFVSLGVARECWITAENLMGHSLAMAALGAIANVSLNLLLLRPFGAQGAAIATLLSYALAALFAPLLFTKTRAVGCMMLRSLLLRC